MVVKCFNENFTEFSDRINDTVMPDTEKKSNWNWRNIIIGILTVALSIGGSIFTSGKEAGKNEEKVFQLEQKVTLLSQDHDRIIRIEEKVDYLTKMVEELKKEKHESISKNTSASHSNIINPLAINWIANNGDSMAVRW